MASFAKKFVRKLVKIVAWFIGGILVLVIILFILIQVPAVQRFAKNKAVSWLQGKLGTKVEIRRLALHFPGDITLENVYLEDQRKDTLFYGGNIRVNVSLWKLLDKEIAISKVELDSIRVNVYRQGKDTSFNYDYILRAFSGSPEKKPAQADTSAPFSYKFGELVLYKIVISYQDDGTGNELYARLGDLKTKIQTVDPVHSIYSIPGIDLSGLTARIRRYRGSLPVVALSPSTKKAPVGSSAESHAASPPLDLRLGTITLQQIGFDYSDEIGATTATARLGTFRAVADKSDWQQLALRFRDLELKNSSIAVSMGKQESLKKTPGTSNDQTPPSASQDTAGWSFAVANLALANNDLQYDDNRQKKAAKGMDYSHLKINRLLLNAQNLQLNPREYKGRIAAASFSEQSGFSLRRLSTDFLYSDKGASLKNIDLQTGLSEIRGQTQVKYTSLQSISRSPGALFMDLDFDRSRIAMRDILEFVPSLATSLKGRESMSLLLTGKVRGPLKDLDVQALELSAPQNTFVSARGHIRGLPDMNKAFFDIPLVKIGTGRRDLAVLLPTGILPSNIHVPDKVLVSGSFSGGIKTFHTILTLQSSNGNSHVDASFSQGDRSYGIIASLDKLDLGAILGQQQNMGQVTARIRAKGAGFDYRTLQADLHADLQSAVLKGYRYTGLLLDGSLHQGEGAVHATIRDSAISFNLDLRAAGLSRKFPALKMDWQLDTVDLHALHLLADTLQFKGLIHADFANTNPDSLQGSLSINDLHLQTGRKALTTDSIALVAQNGDGQEVIRLRSEMIDLDWKGIYKPTETGAAIRQTIRHYYEASILDDSSGTALHPSRTEFHTSDSAHTYGQDWTLVLTARPSPLVLALMPSLKGSDTVHAQVVFISHEDKLQLALNAPLLKVGATTIRQTTLNTSTDDHHLAYRLQTAGITAGTMQLYQTAIYGRAENNRIYTSLLLKDEKAKDRYRVSGALNKMGEGWKFTLNPDSLLLNFDPWQVSRDNYIQYDSSGILVNNFAISNKNESLKINSVAHTTNAPTDISFHDFQISTLSKFANQDSLLVDGVLNGKAEVKNLTTQPVFTSDLQIRDLSYQRDTVGSLVVKVNNEEANTFNADLSVEGHGNDVRAAGKYFTGEGRMDMKLDLQRVNLLTLKTVAAAELEDIKGVLKGHLAVTGTLAAPVVNGNLHFDSTLITPVISGEPLKLSKDNIEFDADGFNFSEFSMADSAGNKATLDGNVYTKDYRNYSFDLSMNAANFRLVNAKAASNRQFYGALNMDASASLSGDMNSLKVLGGLRVNKKTDFFFVLPGSNPEVVDRVGVIRFVDSKHPADTTVDRLALGMGVAKSDIKGMDISLTIETDSNAVFTMVLDERTGDQLTARGRSNLVFGMDKSGKIDLTGGYEVESGSYNLSLDVLKRKFGIQHGSTITWTGDPTTAQLDLTATYAANTPSIDLIANELAGRSETDINKFKQKLPFLVTLKMEGELLKPKITFDITLPTNVLTLWPDVDQKLQQIRNEESELNKQVFALLLLNRFVGDDPLQSQAGGGISVSSMAFQSASQILTNQLDRLAGSLIKGVDIHFDLNNEQDFSTGYEQDYTELNVSVSKRLFNDRIQVNVGSNFDVMGTSNANQNASNIAGDLAVDYKLTKDGRYMVRAYRKNQYEAVVNVQVVETGVSFVLTFDYNRFRELFGHTKEEKLEESKPIKQRKGNSSNQ